MNLKFLNTCMKLLWGLLHNNRAKCRVTEKKIFKFAGAWTLTESRALSVMMSFTLGPVREFGVLPADEMIEVPGVPHHAHQRRDRQLRIPGRYSRVTRQRHLRQSDWRRAWEIFVAER